MKMSQEDAARNRERVVTTAGRMFREHGYDGVGIAALMKASGLTNGAFYKQFDSKEDLIAEATAQALSENADAWRQVLEATDDDPFEAVTAWYLSEPHVTFREAGCTYAALAAEAPRHDEAVRQAFDEGVRRTIEAMAGAANCADDDGGVRAIRHLSRLVGALILARAVDDPELSKRILAANRGSG